MPEWLEKELARELAPVEAPEELWRRVRGGRVIVIGRQQSRPPALLVAAAAMLLATVGAIWLWGSPGRPSPNRATAQGACYTCHASL